MVLFPNAKINIGLTIVEKRPDNYHNIETIFYPIPLNDILEIVPSKGEESSLHLSGIKIDGNADDNLVMRAYRLLKADYNIPPVDIYLEKIIPFGAGLGGGSSDAAFTLKGLNELFELGLDTKALQTYASELGADCAFFIENKPIFATGKGDIFEEIDLSLSGTPIVLVKPDISISTKEAYAHIKPRPMGFPINELIGLPVDSWDHLIENDFEETIFPNHPTIAKIKRALFDNGAIYALMSGSGSSVYGLFDDEKSAKQAALQFPDYFVFEGKLN